MNLSMKGARERFLDQNHDTWKARSFSGMSLSLWQVSARMMGAHCRGEVLDAGAGRSTLRRFIESLGCRYTSLDLAPRGDQAPDVIGDVTDMRAVADGAFDSVVCHQVLEHVRDPAAAARELARVLKKGGVAVVSVPHLSRYHELPHDYFRFTAHGLDLLMQRAGLEQLELEPYGGLLSFLHHQAAFVFPGLLAPVPAVGTMAHAMNAAVSFAAMKMDAATTQRLFPAGLVAAYRKR